MALDTSAPAVGGTQDAIPESLLSMAKDARYLRSCRNLVQNVFTSFVDNSGDTDVSNLSTLVSSILYTLMVLLRYRRTLGMEATGIRFSPQLSKWKILSVSLGTTAIGYIMNRYTAASATRTSAESLRGSRRREFFELQRRRMLERAEKPFQFAAPNCERSKNTSWRERLRSTAQTHLNIFVRLLSAIFKLRLSEEPHELHDGNNAESAFSSYHAVAAFLVRFHLALYCINGRYATFVHRMFLGSSFELANDKSSRLVHRPATYRLVGLLMMAQSLGIVAQGALRSLARVWVNVYETTSRNRSSSPSSTPLFQRNPAVQIDSSTLTVQCDICQQRRKYPACPGCGHVFCWTCLQQWVTTVRPECPLCRTKCQSQHIIPLLNYQPVAEEGA